MSTGIVSTHTKEWIFDKSDTIYAVEADVYDCCVKFRVSDKIGNLLIPCLDGDVRWDGTSRWKSDNGILFVDRDSLQDLSKLITDLWSWAKELLGSNWDDPHVCGNFN